MRLIILILLLLPSVLNAGQSAYLLADVQGQIIKAKQQHLRLVPASIIKILTAEMAIHELGLNYRFKTEFYQDDHHQLLVKGYGDPFLVSEELRLIAQSLKQRGYHSFSGLVLDASAFQVDSKAPGTSLTLNPYDALNGGLIVNFNSLFVTKTASGKLISAEAETPLTPLARSKGKQLKYGQTDRFNLTDNPVESLAYVGELITAIFRQEGIVITREAKIGHRDDTFKLIYRHHNSRSLQAIIQGLLKYSNNYIANQLFLTLGARASGYPATFVKSRAFAQGYLNRHYPSVKDQIKMEEASGISRNNRMTAQSMLLVLERFKPYAGLLSKRFGAYAKSGTLRGVYNYAGYIPDVEGLRSYVIILNQGQNQRDQLLKWLISIP